MGGEMQAEVVEDLCLAFCRDTRSDSSSTAAEKFRHALITNANGEEVRLNQLRLGIHSGVALSKALKTMMLSSLNLHGNVLRDVGAIALLQLLRGHETLRHLNLGSNDITHDGGIAFARELSTLRLLSLELGSDLSSMYTNRFNNKVGVAFGEQLSANTILRKLGLSNTGIGRMEDKQEDEKQEAAQSLGRMLKVNTTLEELKVASNNFGTVGSVLILKGLMENSALVELDLSGNNAGADAGVMAGETLTTNSTLTCFSLARNKIGFHGTSAMAAALVSNSRLTVLDLSDTQMQDRGCIAMANALESNCCLTHFNGSRNGISEQGGLAWADTLWANSTLKSLNLSENPLGDEVAVNIAGKNSMLLLLLLLLALVSDLGSSLVCFLGNGAGVLSQNDSLKKLELSSCKLKNTSLTRLRLANNLISETGGMLLAGEEEKVAHASLLRVQKECSRKKQATESKEPSELAAQIRVLKRKEQKILEYEFRIGKALAARKEAEKILGEEKRMFEEAQGEWRMKIDEAQGELNELLQAVEDAERRLEEKTTEKQLLLKTHAERMEVLGVEEGRRGSQEAGDREGHQAARGGGEQLNKLIAEATMQLADVEQSKKERVEGLRSELEQNQQQILELEKETRAAQEKLRQLEAEKQQASRTHAIESTSAGGRERRNHRQLNHQQQQQQRRRRRRRSESEKQEVDCVNRREVKEEEVQEWR
ncbi:hypothetical protein GUITHDRAFT_165715 [Guillardia theta CCMP2712]|uniref:Uncharacterized protein n=1 Tax=Guillardia theta (strain CCMP2712) TaxID=905079 RepID=L1IJU8_GUITC|nr:hypothetical protein GUITHDRAFT_165715 [Guillardia theta CCMP2712]EKX36511.1 hypothetical protein GUITHDRAFT_165715 [Guillardia theta CCMP2712]|eukprot:XP_005823491.1 hypothetical protein GUITHDRAFT_165715 [Guillardia theta CCMP2712]